MHSKGVKDKGDVDLCIDYESWDKMVWEFVFEKKDKDGKGIENSVVFSKDIVGWGRDNSILLIYQYQVIIRSIII